MTVETPEQVTDNLLIEKQTPLEKKEVVVEPKNKEKEATENKEDEVKKEEKPYPPEGSKRWNDIYKKAKDNERKVKQLEADIELLREHNKQIAESRKLESEAIVKLNEKTNKDRIKELRVNMKRAEADGDYEKAVEYESQIDDLKSQIEQRADYQKPDNNDKKPVSQTPKYSEETQKAVEKFTKENPWFDEDSEEYDEIMADAAIMMDSKLVQTWSGTINERFAEVKKKIEERFNYKKNGEGVNKLPNVNSGDNPPSLKTGIDLTPDQKRVAHMLFPDDKNAEKKYLKQLQSIPKKG